MPSLIVTRGNESGKHAIPFRPMSKIWMWLLTAALVFHSIRGPFDLKHSKPVMVKATWGVTVQVSTYFKLYALLIKANLNQEKATDAENINKSILTNSWKLGVKFHILRTGSKRKEMILCSCCLLLESKKSDVYGQRCV